MAINPSIPLQVQPGPNMPGVFQAAQNFQQGEKRNQLMDLALQDAQKTPGFAEVTEQELGVVDAVLNRIRPSVSSMTPEQIAAEVQQGAQALQQETGRQSPIFAEMLKDLQTGGVEAFVGGLKEYDEIRNPQKPVPVTEGTALVNPSTQQEVYRNPREPKPQARVMTDDEKRQAGLDPSLPFQRKADGTITLIQTGSEAGDVRSRKIADLRRLHNLSEGQAVNLVDGHSRSEISPLGNVVTIDEVARTAQEVPLSSDLEPVPEPEPGRTLWDLAEVATGPVNSMTAKGASALSFFGLDPEQAATQSQQVFKTETQNLIRAMSINPRFPVGEMERIREEIDIQPSFFKGQGILREQMKAVSESLSRRMKQAERDAKDPNLDMETRQSQRANASAIRNFLPILGVPETATNADKLNERIRQLEQELGL